jgi:hypothetical protein
MLPTVDATLSCALRFQRDRLFLRLADVSRNSSLKAAFFEDDRGSRNVAWNLVAMPSSGDGLWLGDLGDHLFSNTLLACFSGTESRQADLAARRSLRRGTTGRGGLLERFGSGAAAIMWSRNGFLRAAMNVPTLLFAGSGMSAAVAGDV